VVIQMLYKKINILDFSIKLNHSLKRGICEILPRGETHTISMPY
jgi:hypothetical protein